jgi:hypothetical protein
MNVTPAHTRHFGERIAIRYIVGIFESPANFLHGRNLLFHRRKCVRSAALARPEPGFFGRIPRSVELNIFAACQPGRTGRTAIDASRSD